MACIILCSRVIKSDMEIAILRYTNKISSDAHKKVVCEVGLQPHSSTFFIGTKRFRVMECLQNLMQ